MRSFILALTVLVGGAAVAQETQDKCIPYGAALAYFFKDHNERPIVTAIMDQGLVIQILAKPDGSTWTMLNLRPDGTACMIATGTDWRVKAGA